ncbi:hypothetical protein BCR42DRAFT_186467 [Absidia repens]|uniref:Uncharacterized protein n=1 Tax=Absidia repens TaxID=90262 RepID=A0A1X2IRB0_9FUNG|nr:hypothetical protein BCR42DRAFT_186467 [Absidia repens]
MAEDETPLTMVRKTVFITTIIITITIIIIATVMTIVGHVKILTVPRTLTTPVQAKMGQLIYYTNQNKATNRLKRIIICIFIHWTTTEVLFWITTKTITTITISAALNRIRRTRTIVTLELVGPRPV